MLRHIRLLLVLLIGTVVMAGCSRPPSGPPQRPPLTGEAANQEDRRLEAELEKISGVRSATVSHTTGNFNVSNSLWVNIDSPATTGKDLDAISDSALPALWNTRQFVPVVVYFAVADGAQGAGSHDLRRLRFRDQGAAYGDELRRRYGAPFFEGPPPSP